MITLISFPTLESMYMAFEKFVDLLPEDGTLIVCAEDAGAAALIPHVRNNGRNIVSYGMQGDMTINTPLWVQARDVKPNERGGFDFVVTSNLASKTSAPIKVSLQVPGEHNVRNALARVGDRQCAGSVAQESCAEPSANLPERAAALNCAAR